jgi:RecA/RadA recombinase
LLPTGCALLNAALSDSVAGGYGAGRVVNMIGDSSAGKSMLALTGMAEMANDSRFDDYVLLYDGVEPPDFDIRRLFGTKLRDRLEAGHQYVAEACGLEEYYPPETIQQYYGRMLQLLEGDQPVFAVLDSFDAITTTEELARANDMAKGKETGSYKMEKARWASEILRVLSRKIENTGSAIVIVSQTRDNIDPIGFQKKTRAGGKALEFYACHIFWLAKAGNIPAPNKMKIGSKVLAKTTKNKLTGKWRDVQFPIYYQIGVDDIGSAVDYLVDNSSEWKKTGPTVTCDTLDLKGYKTAVVKVIEESPEMWATVKQQLQEAWDAQEAKADLGRKPRFK